MASGIFFWMDVYLIRMINVTPFSNWKTDIKEQFLPKFSCPSLMSQQGLKETGVDYNIQNKISVYVLNEKKDD
jgi:hypothetical protein